MSGNAVLDTYRFTTTTVPENRRFVSWAAAISTCDYEPPIDAAVPFDAEFCAMRFGPFVLTWRRWLREDQAVSYRTVRSRRKIRADGIDHFHLMLQLKGGSAGQFGRSSVQTRAGGLYLFDMGEPFDCVTTAGETIGLLIRRVMFQSLDLNPHGAVFDPAMKAILIDHLRALCGNMGALQASDIPYVTRATSNLLRAGLTGLGSMQHRAVSEVDLALTDRVLQFVKLNILQAHLSPEFISKAIGISRAKLYQLFQGSGGIMRWIQRQRLERAYEVLTDPDWPHERIASIAWRHGFADEKYFSRIFRARFGCTPREARESQRGPRFEPRIVDSHVVGPTFGQWLNADGR
ncbi:helix-turn-helix domain-containing protein [Burkholderia stagnalis]